MTEPILDGGFIGELGVAEQPITGPLRKNESSPSDETEKVPSDETEKVPSDETEKVPSDEIDGGSVEDLNVRERTLGALDQVRREITLIILIAAASTMAIAFAYGIWKGMGHMAPVWDNVKVLVFLAVGHWLGKKG